MLKQRHKKGKEMNQKEEMKKRTKKFALDIVDFVSKLPKSQTAYVLGHQLLRSGTSVGANYRASCRAKSKADFISKTSIVEEEADETGYWLELLIESGISKGDEINSLLDEANQLTAIMVASLKTARNV
jgi:four helix bundle protein